MGNQMYWKPPFRARPAPTTLVSFLLNLAHSTTKTSPAELALADVIYLGFFFLLRPGECTSTTNK